MTGFLGSGKTTLLNRLLAAHGRRMRIVVIENEVGSIGIDDKLVDNVGQLEQSDELILMPNGCLCCRVRGDLVDAFKRILGRSQGADGVILELSGLSTLAPVVQTFFADMWVQRHIQLDSIICVVDALQAHRLSSQDCPESIIMREQLSLADTVLVNKIETVGDDAESLSRLIGGINVTCRIYRCSLLRDENLPLALQSESFLKSDSFSLKTVNEISDLLESQSSQPKVHDHGDNHGHSHGHGRLQVSKHLHLGFTSLCVTEHIAPIDVDAFRAWLEYSVFATCPEAVIRFKAVIWTQKNGQNEQWVGHGVYGKLEFVRRKVVFKQEEMVSIFVFIGPLDDKARFGRLKERLHLGVRNSVLDTDQTGGLIQGRLQFCRVGEYLTNNSSC